MKSHRIISTRQEFLSYCKTVDPTELIVYDSETTGLTIDDKILGIALCDKTDIPVFVITNFFFKNGISINDIREVANEYFPKWEGITHNGKYDLGMFTGHGIADIKIKDDSLIMIHTIDPELIKKLETRVTEDLGFSKKTFESIIGKKWDKIDWSKEGEALLPMLAEYACEDVYYTKRLRDHYLKLLEEDPDLLKIHDEMEIPLIPVLRDMWVRGVNIDEKLLNKMGSKIQGYLTILKDQIHESAGCIFNINSSQQKAEILFDKFGYEPLKRTKGGKPATDKDTMVYLAAKGYPIAQLLTEYQELNTLNTNFVSKIPTWLDKDRRLRGSFNASGTKTGRFSSNNPNLQNQPNNKKFPVRQAYIPTDGYLLLGADYSQIELRVMGHAAQDKRFIEAFWNGEDIHGRVASDLGITRKEAKVVNFGVLYSMGPSKLAASLGISMDEAKEIIYGYQKTYIGYTNWKRNIEAEATRTGYVKTLFGRRRLLPGYNSKDKKLYYAAMRRVGNTAIQGSSADIIKIAMVAIHEKYKKYKMDAHLLLQVHDELIAEASQGCAADAYEILVDTMENTIKLSVPLIADGKIMTDWSAMKKDDDLGLYNELKNPSILPWLTL